MERAALLERLTEPAERLAPEERFTLPDEERETLPVVVRRFCELTEGREAEPFEREALTEGREADERPALEEGLETLAEERDEPEDLDMPAEGLEALEERDTPEEERLAPPPYEERPALEDRETEDELCPEDDERLDEEEEARPPPPRDCAKVISGVRARAATTTPAKAILKNLFISAVCV